MRFNRLALPALVAALNLAGCAGLVPNNEPARPATLPVPATLSAGPVATASLAADAAVPVVPDDWHRLLRDPRLQHLVDQALAHNLDLRLATLNIDAARAALRSSQADRWPTVNASAGATATGTASGVTRQASLALGISAWELDLWGRLARLNDAAEASLQATEQTRRSVQLSLVTATGQAWLSLAAQEQLLALASRTLDSRERSLALTRQRQALGAASGLDLRSAEAALESARGDQAVARTSRQQALNALRVLLGTEPLAELLPGPDEPTDAATVLPAVPGELPASVLLRRPDVQAAERSLQATEAELAAAHAALFPTLSLTTSAGTASSALGRLFKAGSSVWTLAPSLKLPLLDGGASHAALDSARVSRAKQLASYEQTVQTAYQEAADALATRADLGQRLGAQQALVKAWEQTLDLTERRRAAGAASALEVLDAQRSLYSAQQALISLQLTEQGNRLTLYKVLGGA